MREIGIIIGSVCALLSILICLNLDTRTVFPCCMAVYNGALLGYWIRK